MELISRDVFCIFRLKNFSAMKNIKSVFVFAMMVLATTSLTAQEITAFHSMWGEHFYQDKEKLSWKEINTIMMESQASEMYWQKSKKQMFGGLIAGTANLGSAIWYLVNENDDKDTTAPIVSFAGTAVIGSIFYHLAMKNKKQAILEYNDGLDKSTSLRLEPTSNENGIGLALKF